MRLNVKPDFLIIGAQKAGTSSLRSWLVAHPDVVPTRSKELHWFDRRYLDEPLRRYWAEFPTRPGMALTRLVRRRRVVTGEATPAYLAHPTAPARVRAVLPDVKLVAVLREPVERAVSQYWMGLNNGEYAMTIEEALDEERVVRAEELARVARGEEPTAALLTRGFVWRGLYADQLARWLDQFPREQLLIVHFDDLARDPLAVYRRVAEFVGVDPDVAPPPRFTVVNVGRHGHVAAGTLARLADEFHEPNERLARQFGVEFSPR